MNNNSANRYEEGYLIREIPIKSLNVEEATPPVAELQAFNQVSIANYQLQLLCTISWLLAQCQAALQFCTFGVPVILSSIAISLHIPILGAFPKKGSSEAVRHHPYLLHITGTADVYLLPCHLASQHSFMSVTKGKPGLHLALGFA